MEASCERLKRLAEAEGLEATDWESPSDGETEITRGLSDAYA